LSNTAAARFSSFSVATTRAGASAQVVSPHNHATENAEWLIASVRAGDRDALSYLFRQFAGPIWSIGRRILRNDAEADDLVQDVFLYIHRKAGLFDGSKSSARSWIFQIAYTQAFLRRRRLKSGGLWASGIVDSRNEIESPTISGADYDQTAEGLFGRLGWRRMLESLTEEQRETLTLHFFEGLTFAEIAERLGQSYANVRNHHYRGLEKLRRYLIQNPLSRR